MKSHLLPGLLACLLAAGPAAGAEWGLDAATAINHDDNLSNAIEKADRKPDGFATVNLSGLLHQQIGDNTGLGVSLVADSASYFQYSDLNNFAVGARAQLRHKFGLGADASWTSFALRVMHRDYNYDYRDGWQYDASLSAGRRFGERWDASASATYDRYEADKLQAAVLPGMSTAAYDVAGWTFGAQATYLVTEVDTLSISGSWRHGSVTSVTPRHFEVLKYSSAVARDPVFSGNPIAYRINVDSDTLSANWSHALGRHASVNLGYAYRRSHSDEELDAYTSNMFSLSVSYSR